jgi:hypothetical protein
LYICRIGTIMTSDAYDKLILKEAQDEENVTDDAEDE